MPRHPGISTVVVAAICLALSRGGPRDKHDKNSGIPSIVRLVLGVLYWSPEQAGAANYLRCTGNDQLSRPRFC